MQKIITGDIMKKDLNDITKREYRKVVKADANDCPEDDIDSFRLANMYGTYEIQPTADTSNIFPTISQGLSKDWKADLPKNKKP